jgi:hypothetical protein
VALRRDLIDRVFRLARDAGFQEEKFESLYLELRWTKGQICEVLDRRVNHLVRRRYTKNAVGYKELLPNEVRGRPIDDYIFSIADRPRDVIAFFNSCIVVATDSPKLSAAQLRDAEADYSRGRLRALADEWSADHPTLLDFTQILVGKEAHFKARAITSDEIVDLCLQIIASNPGGRGLLHDGARAVVDTTLTADRFKLSMLQVFYRVGLIGIKLSPDRSFSWTDEPGGPLLARDIAEETSVAIAPRYSRALAIRE